jgi:hypothetical protein
LYGIEAINAHNGWAISVVGITIVFSGLVMLSLVISQLHKVLALWEDPTKIKALFAAKKKKDQVPEDSLAEDPDHFNSGQQEIAKQFALLARTMDDHFSLPRLLELAQISGLQSPFSTLNTLLKAKIIVPDGSGYFCWDKERFDRALAS